MLDGDIRSNSEIFRFFRAIRRLLGGQSAGYPTVAGLDPRGEYWRRVPRINVLPQRRRTVSAALVRSLVLALFVAILAYAVQIQYQNRSDVDDEIKLAQLQLDSAKLQVDQLQQQTEPIQTEISVLKREHEAAVQAYQELTAGNINWHGAVESLLLDEISEVILNAILADPAGALTLVGISTDPDTRAKLPNQLQAISEGVDFQGIQWRPESDPPEFTSTFKITK